MRGFCIGPIFVAAFGTASLPYAPARKYPSAGRDLGWQYVFPSVQRLIDPTDGIDCGHHFDDAILVQSLKKANLRAQIVKPLSALTRRHAFATHLFETG